MPGFSRDFPQVNGAIYFSAKDVRADRRKTTTRLVNRFYSRPAITPVVGNPTGPQANPPVNPRWSDGLLTWTANDEAAARYAIYQIPQANAQTCDTADARHLVAIVPATGSAMQWQGQNLQGSTLITAIDRWGRESAPISARG